MFTDLRFEIPRRRPDTSSFNSLEYKRQRDQVRQEQEQQKEKEAKEFKVMAISMTQHLFA